MDWISVRHLKSERIGRDTRFHIISEYGLDTMLGTDMLASIKDRQPKNVKVHCSALALFANMILCNLLEDVNKLKAVCSLKQDDVVAAMRALPKYAGKTDNELVAEMNRCMQLDIRNAFAHGLFEIACPNGNPVNGVFVLKPNRSVINGLGLADDYKIGVEFKRVQELVHEYIHLQAVKAINSTDYVQKAVGEKRGEAIDSFLVPSTLCAMVDKWMGKPAMMTKSLQNPLVQAYVHIPLSFATVVYDLNSQYARDGKDDDLFALDSTLRNAFAHGGVHLDSTGTKIKAVDPGKTDATDIVEDDFTAVMSVMELIHASQNIFEAKIKSGAISEDDYKKLSPQDRLLITLDEIANLGKDDNIKE